MNNKQPSTPVIVALTIVAVCAIGSVALIIITLDKSELPEGWLGLYLAFLGATIAGIVGIARIAATIKDVGEAQAKVARQVDDLYNGRGDAKHRAAVGDVLRDDLIDDGAREQLERDRARRDEH